MASEILSDSIELKAVTEDDDLIPDRSALVNSLNYTPFLKDNVKGYQYQSNQLNEPTPKELLKEVTMALELLAEEQETDILHGLLATARALLKARASEQHDVLNNIVISFMDETVWLAYANPHSVVVSDENQGRVTRAVVDFTPVAQHVKTMFDRFLTEYPSENETAEVDKLFQQEQTRINDLMRDLSHFCPKPLDTSSLYGSAANAPMDNAEAVESQRVIKDIFDKEAERLGVVLDAVTSNQQTSKDEARECLHSILRPGDILEGKVTSCKTYGVFVDLGVSAGLVHKSELTWSNTPDPRRILSIGDKIEVQVIEVDQERSRIRLSLRLLYPDLYDHLNEGQCIDAIVTKVKPYGVFVLAETMPVEGLIKFDTNPLNRSDGRLETLEVGDHVRVEIVGIDRKKGLLRLHLAPPELRIGLDNQYEDRFSEKPYSQANTTLNDSARRKSG